MPMPMNLIREVRPVMECPDMNTPVREIRPRSARDIAKDRAWELSRLLAEAKTVAEDLLASGESPANLKLRRIVCDLSQSSVDCAAVVIALNAE